MRTNWCRQAARVRGSSGCWQGTCTGMRAPCALRWRAATGGWLPPPESISCPLSEVNATASKHNNTAVAGVEHSPLCVLSGLKTMFILLCAAAPEMWDLIVYYLASRTVLAPGWIFAADLVAALSCKDLWFYRTAAAAVWDDGEDSHLEKHSALGWAEPSSKAANLDRGDP